MSWQPKIHVLKWLTLPLFFAPAAVVQAQESVSLVEPFAPGLEHHVSTRVKLSGELLVPVEKDKPPQMVKMKGESAIEYDERILPQGTDPAAQKALRVYRQIDFHRTIGDRAQEMNLRPEVRKIVLLRAGRAKNSFSPDGPLTWGEIDLLRTDIFTPALAGLLPTNAVKPGESWKASAAAAIELTDLEKIEDGELECRLDEVTTVASRKVAHIRISGTLTGVNEDGPNRQVLNGTLYFDLESNFISYLSIRGEHHLLDKDGKTAGKIAGMFVMTRSLNPHSRELTDDAIGRLSLEPNADNTALLYDNRDLGIRFLYPRRWKVGRVQGTQVTLDDPEGNGILLTIEPLKRLPTAENFLKETTDYLAKQKAKVLGLNRPQRIAQAPAELDRFTMSVEVGGKKVLMDYYIARQARGGAIVAGRLLDKDRDATMKEVERMARSVTITRDLNDR